jgi:hypothetical protein
MGSGSWYEAHFSCSIPARMCVCVCELLFISGLLHLELCCLQKNVLLNWLRNSTLHYIPLHHKMSGYEGLV